MKSFLKVKSVGSGMVRLLDDFCAVKKLKSPLRRHYGIDERMTFGSWLAKLKYVDRQYKQEGLGLEIGAMIDPSYIGISGYISNSCTTLSDIFANSLKYNKIWYNYMPRSVLFSDQEVCVSWGKPAYVQAGLFVHETAISEELQVAIFYTRLQQIVDDRSVKFSRIQMAIPMPQDIKKYEDFFGCPIEFDQAETQFYLHARDLDLNIKRADPVLYEILKTQADAILSTMSQDDSMLEMINQHILASIHQTNAHVDYVASRMDISPRALQNYLKEKNSSFNALLSEIRLNLARQYLSDPKLSILDVSFLLAYKEQSSFNRAFKKWTGSTPTQWREDQQLAESVEVFSVSR